MSNGKSGTPKRGKGISIGAAMGQRMNDQQQDAESPIQPTPDKSARQRTTTSQPSFSEAPLATTTIPETSMPALLDLPQAESLEPFNTRLPAHLHRRLKIQAASEGRKIQDIVRTALTAYLDRASQQ